jgi:hypothetical protein
MTPEPLAIVEPAHVLAAVDNLLAAGLLTARQARGARLFARQPEHVTIERIGHAIHARTASRHVRLMANGAIRNL